MPTAEPTWKVERVPSRLKLADPLEFCAPTKIFIVGIADEIVLEEPITTPSSYNAAAFEAVLTSVFKTCSPLVKPKVTPPPLFILILLSALKLRLLTPSLEAKYLSLLISGDSRIYASA